MNRVPKLVLAADHRARGVITTERYDDLLASLRAGMQHCDGILATYQPLCDLADDGSVTRKKHATYLSINRTGLAGSIGELDDRLVASVEGVAAQGWRGIKHMTRIDMDSTETPGALELLGRVLEDARANKLEALIEAVMWREGHMAHDTESIINACVIAHDMGAPLLKVPIPRVEPGEARKEAVARIITSVGVPVLFLGGPRKDSAKPATSPTLLEAKDVMAGGGAGLAIGRTIYQDPDPAGMARLLREIVDDAALAE